VKLLQFGQAQRHRVDCVEGRDFGQRAVVQGRFLSLPVSPHWRRLIVWEKSALLSKTRTGRQ
jgi:hypothetical protein